MDSFTSSTEEHSSLVGTTVLLVDDHEIWRGGILAMLEDTEFRVVGEASSGDEAVEQARALTPEIVLLDIRMSGGDGLEALDRIKRELPRTSVIMLTTYDNPTYMARAVTAGASGYLLKGIPFEELLAALRCVARGEMLLSRETFTQSLRAAGKSAVDSKDLIHPLSAREEEVLRLLATGLNNRDIASMLFISESTVKTHVEHILGKLGVSDRVQAAVWAARHGLSESQ